MNEITKQQLLEYVAPCSLLCYTCPGCKGGVICKHAEVLDHYFEGFYEFQKENLPEKFREHAEKFKAFYDKLKTYTMPNCEGCRNEKERNFCMPACIIPGCAESNGVDFCGECDNFPCDKVSKNIYNEGLIEKWFQGSSRIKEVGIERFFEEEKNTPHYIEYKRKD